MRMFSIALTFGDVIDNVVSFVECVILLESNLMCRSYKCVNEDVSAGS